MAKQQQPRRDLTPLDWSDDDLDRMSEMDTEAARDAARAWLDRHASRGLSDALDAPEQPTGDGNG